MLEELGQQLTQMEELVEEWRRENYQEVHFIVRSIEWVVHVTFVPI